MDKPETVPAPAAPEAPPSRWSELDALQQEVARRIRDNQKFLDNFLDEDYQDADDTADDDGEDFEEL